LKAARREKRARLLYLGNYILESRSHQENEHGGKRRSSPAAARDRETADAPLRLAAGSKDPMVTLEQMQRIDPAARVFDGVGHNPHWKAPDQVWSFVARSR
jgi:pimeloyl-ACP methyl ester carboxylesterase